MSDLPAGDERVKYDDLGRRTLKELVELSRPRIKQPIPGCLVCGAIPGVDAPGRCCSNTAAATPNQSAEYLILRIRVADTALDALKAEYHHKATATQASFDAWGQAAYAHRQAVLALNAASEVPMPLEITPVEIKISGYNPFQLEDDCDADD